MKKTILSSLNSCAITCFSFLIVGLFLSNTLYAQDTLRISLQEFIEKGVELSQELQLKENDVLLAKNTVRSTEAKKWLPKFEITTNHGISPSAEGDDVDNIEVDWSKIRTFNRVEFSMLQPIYTWGALNNAINAAKAGAEAAEKQLMAKELDVRKQMFDLYQSKVLATHLKGLLDETEGTLNRATKEINQMLEDGSSDVRAAHQYKLKLFSKEFAIKKAELEQQTKFVDAVWDLVLDNEDQKVVYLPEASKMQASAIDAIALHDLLSHSITASPNLNAIDQGIEAAKFGLKAQKAAFYPMLFLGLGGEYVNTPVPVAQKPLIGTRRNYANVVYSFGFRINLSYGGLKADKQKREIQLKQALDAKSALVTATKYQVRDSYKDLMLAQSVMDNKGEAFKIAKEWQREEEMNYDLEIGEVKDLIDAIQSSLQYEADYVNSIYEYNLKLGKLYKEAGYTLGNIK